MFSDDGLQLSAGCPQHWQMNRTVNRVRRTVCPFNKIQRREACLLLPLSPPASWRGTLWWITPKGPV